MGYLSTGAVGFTKALDRQAIVAARSAIGAFLDQLKSQPKTAKNSPSVMKILPSNDSVFTGKDIAMSMVNAPTVWTGSNVIAWPAGQLGQYEAAWGVLTGYMAATGHQRTGKLQFARNLTSVPLAIQQTTDLLEAVDEQMARDGLPVPSNMKLYLGLAALVGVAIYASRNKVKGAVTGRRRRKRS